MPAAAVAGPPFSAREEGLPSPSSSPSPSPSPPRSPSPSAAADMTPNPDSSPEPDSSPIRTDPAAGLAPRPAVTLARLLPSQPALSVSRRLPPPCWTQEETDALIQSYRQKWYALRRGHLRASHWEEVAEAVTRRCRHLYVPGGPNSPKTAVQCRHKMEKLRKRYRSEKRRPHRTSWVHFRDMDAMEMGMPAGGSVSGPRSRPVVVATPPDAYAGEDDEDESDEDEDEDDGDENDEEDDEEGQNNVGGTRSVHAVLAKANGVPAMGDLRFQIPKAVRTKVSTPRADDRANATTSILHPKFHHASDANGFFKEFSAGLARKPPSAAEEMRKKLEERRRKEREGAAFGELVAALRVLGEGFLRVEEMKMEMAREMEKLRMEMELKHTEMILESQRWIVEAFVKGLTHGPKKKRAKVGPDSS